MPLPGDGVLVAGLRARDEDIFVQVVDAWTPTMLRVARGHVASQESAADVVQDTWLAVLRGIDGYEGRAALRTWVFRILTNIAKTRGTREQRIVPWSPLAEDGHPTVAHHRFRGANDEYPGGWKTFPPVWPTPEGEAMSAEIRTKVGGAISSLPERQRIVITMRDLDGFSSDEVCELLGLTPANQRVLLHRARATVRSLLENHFGSAARWGATP
ncbi:MAG: sigma-70 family RNA polymerase sigma factor [Nocardioidaceae bacterium]